MDFSDIRRVVITAIYADDILQELLVLKGGNALNLVYGLSGRTSIDLDFSLAQDFPDLENARARLFHSLRERFDAVGLVVFDERLEAKPAIEGEDVKPWWGGYEVRFKLTERAKYQALAARPDKLSIGALVTGEDQRRTFTIDVSKCEYVEGRAEVEFDDYTISVYTPEMIVIEKLRAICQQMDEYPHTGSKKARARDFFDIWQVVTKKNIDLTTDANRTLARHVFDAKRVPLELLSRVASYRERHRPDWPAVRDTAGQPVEDFDAYFDFVLGQVERLKTLWSE